MRLSKLASLNIDQVDSDVISIIGKGNKERKIYLTPAVKQSLAKWLAIRSTLKVDCNALFISRNRGRLTTRSTYKTSLKSISLPLVSIQKAYPRISFVTLQLHACTSMGM
ncbi:putative site-specific recombinase [Oscillibacter valericigenes Sjm18-20]|nr:putative site-specific recombinase [Oscillibacter valericigenes Sjm18-20]